MAETADAQLLEEQIKVDRLLVRIKLFDAQCKEDHYTDTGEAWNILRETQVVLTMAAERYDLMIG